MRTALITGCSPGGIGHALALELQKRGLRVIGTGRRLDKVADLQDLGIDCVTLTVDDPESVIACHSEVRKLLSGRGLDYLINNAGVAIFRPATETDLEECKRMFGANVFGVIDMCQAFLPELVLAKGSIINIGSVAGHMPLPFMSTYCASKAALHAFSESLRLEVAPLGVKVTYVQTGNVKTNKIPWRYHIDKRSLWYPVKDAYEKQHDKAALTGMDLSDFANALASRILSRHGDTIWVGEGTWACRIFISLEHWLPFRILPFALSQMYGMGRIKVHRG